jgi:hypothetical protein
VLVAVLLGIMPKDEWVDTEFIPKSWVINGDRWTAVTRERGEKEDLERYLTFTKNGRFAYRINGPDIFMWNLEAYRAWWPTPWPVFVVACTQPAGHGACQIYLAIQDGELKQVLEIEESQGGPIFRDLDGDGVMEWIFDNREYYERNVPDKFQVYKVNAKGTLDLWQEWPNPKGERVPSPSFAPF